MRAEPLRLATLADPPADAPAAGLLPLLTATDLAGLLAVSTATYHRLRAGGRIGPAPVRLGHGRSLVRYDPVEVAAWLRSRRPDGRMHDARTWAAIWAAAQRGGRP